MDLVFADPATQEICSSLTLFVRKHGERAARRAVAHLASMRAAPSLEEFRYLPGRCRETGAGRQLAVDVTEDLYFIFEPATEVPVDGQLDWTAVRSIRIVSIAAGAEMKVNR